LRGRRRGYQPVMGKRVPSTRFLKIEKLVNWEN
jgi:hypothetical protein